MIYVGDHVAGIEHQERVHRGVVCVTEVVDEVSRSSMVAASIEELWMLRGSTGEEMVPKISPDSNSRHLHSGIGCQPVEKKHARVSRPAKGEGRSTV